jgi:hypothetical protein
MAGAAERLVAPAIQHDATGRSVVTASPGWPIHRRVVGHGGWLRAVHGGLHREFSGRAWSSAAPRTRGKASRTMSEPAADARDHPAARSRTHVNESHHAGQQAEPAHDAQRSARDEKPRPPAGDAANEKQDDGRHALVLPDPRSGRNPSAGGPRTASPSSTPPTSVMASNRRPVDLDLAARPQAVTATPTLPIRDCHLPGAVRTQTGHLRGPANGRADHHLVPDPALGQEARQRQAEAMASTRPSPRFCSGFTKASPDHAVLNGSFRPEVGHRPDQ